MQITKKLYIFLLSFMLSGILLLGIIVAPIIFQSNLYIEPQLSRIENGLLMSQIFFRFNYILVIGSILSLIYEFYYNKKLLNRVITIVNLSLVSIFAFYFTPYIIESAKTTNITEKFELIHKLSELDFKLLAVLLMILLFKNLGVNSDRD